MRTVRTLGLAALVGAALAAGCHKPAEMEPIEINYEAPLPPGQLALRKITDPRAIPDLTAACARTADLRAAVENSLHYLQKPSSHQHFPYGTLTHDQAVASLQAFLGVLDSRAAPTQMNRAILDQFDVYISVGCDQRGTVLFTCYYTPIFQGSPVRTEKFRYPLYKAPPDLVKGPDGTPTTPLPDRRTIETSGMYAGNELAWMADPFEAYVAQVQGSVKLRMPDGRLATVGYTANNGHEYQSVRAELVKDGKIGKRDGLPAMIRYFRAHPAEVTPYTWRNPRYVFFAPVEDGRPRGCLNEPVTARRTVATDKKIFPPACLAVVATKLPERRGAGIVDVGYSGFALDQDSGGAIRAAGRCDLYLGVGDEAGELAGRAQNEGKLYYLFLKPGKAVPTNLAPTSPAPAAPRAGP